MTLQKSAYLGVWGLGFGFIFGFGYRFTVWVLAGRECLASAGSKDSVRPAFDSPNRVRFVRKLDCAICFSDLHSLFFCKTVALDSTCKKHKFFLEDEDIQYYPLFITLWVLSVPHVFSFLLTSNTTYYMCSCKSSCPTPLVPLGVCTPYTMHGDTTRVVAKLAHMLIRYFVLL